MASRHEKTDAEKKVEGDIAKMDLYGLLEVEADATEKVILKAYRSGDLFTMYIHIRFRKASMGLQMVNCKLKPKWKSVLSNLYL